MASMLLALLLTLAAPALAAESSSGESILVFDLANPDSIVEEHTARLLWNLATDNVVADRVGNQQSPSVPMGHGGSPTAGRFTTGSRNGTVQSGFQGSAKAASTR